MKTSIPSRLTHLKKIGALSLTMLAASALLSHAADIRWTGGTASYTNAILWDSNSVPGATDNAINANGLNNVVQINAGNPDWTVNDISAGGITGGAGAFTQNGQTVNVNGWMLLGSGTNATGIYTLNSGTVNVIGGRLFLGDHPNSTSALNINGGVINKSGDVFVISDGGWNGLGTRVGTVTQSGGTVNSSSELWVGNFDTGDGTYILSGGSITNSNWFAVGRDRAKGTLIMSGGSITKNGGGNFYVGEGNGGVGQFDFTGGTINCDNEFWLANGGTSLAIANMSGSASLSVNNWLAIGRNGGNGTWNLTNGTINKTGSGNIAIGAGGGSVGTLNQHGGTLNNTSNPNSITYLAEAAGNGTWNMNGGTANLGVLQFCQAGAGIGALNLNGGVLSAFEVNCGVDGANGTLSFNG
ncbi:MAG: hypothetical protein H7Y43_14170, partial [Akkermansiaceae bacterium]|nr:hypothetical protein [Verrucomicrobiales bacterium]